MPRPWLLSCLFIFTLLPAGPGEATSIVVVSDGDLVDQADVIVKGTVTAAAPAPSGPRTDYFISPSRVLKGSTGKEITVRVPGGETPDGYRLHVWGSPRLQPGTEVLLFLGNVDDGVYAPLHLMLGVFRLVGDPENGFALRDFSEVNVVGTLGTERSDKYRVRQTGAFEAWIERTVGGQLPEVDYFRLLPVSTIHANFNLFKSPSTGLNIRWFDFERERSVPWFIRIPEFGDPPPGVTQLQNAIDAWNQAPGTLIRYEVGGTTQATGGLDRFDQINAVIFDDPNDEITGSFSCVTGGVLAIGGPWFGPSTRPFRDRLVHAASGADIVFNDGIECVAGAIPNPLVNLEEVLGHELGHTLGIDHSCGDQKTEACRNGTPPDDALMRTVAHLDSRGAALKSDDMEAAVELYPAPAPPRRRVVRRP